MSNRNTKTWMQLPGRYLKAASTGLVVGFLFAFLLGRSVWVEMRINIGHVIPISVACFVFFFALRKRSITFVSFLLLELFAFALAFSIYGFSFSAVLIVPAALFRDGFHLGFLSLSAIGLFLFCSMGTMNAVWMCDAVMTRRKDRGGRHPATDRVNV